MDAAADTAEEAVDAAADTAEEAADAAAETTSITELLTVDGFNYDKVAEYIDGSDLNLVAKTGAKALLEQAKSNPDGLAGILDQLKGALGL